MLSPNSNSCFAYGTSYLVAHVVRVWPLLHIHDGDVMSEHELLHVLVHEPADLDEVLGLIAMIHHLLESRSVTNQPFEVPLITFHHLLVLLMVQTEFVVHSHYLLHMLASTCLWFYISARSLRFYTAGS